MFLSFRLAEIGRKGMDQYRLYAPQWPLDIVLQETMKASMIAASIEAY